MIRLLFAVALGGAVSLIILSMTGSPRFTKVGVFFIIATMVLFFGSILIHLFAGGRRARREILEARSKGRIRAALILSRSQTGLFVNEQPQVDFTLLVDRPGKKPFVTSARTLVSMIDLHEVVPGTLIAVAHPEAEYNTVHMLDGEQPPAPSQELNAELAADAAKLPKKERPITVTRNMWVLAGAFVVGVVGAPFLATPNPMQYVEYLVGGKQGSVARLDHPFLFEADELVQSIDAMTQELGHAHVRSFRVTDVALVAEAPASPGATQIDRVRVQDYEIVDREPRDVIPPEFAEEPMGGFFSVYDVDWAAVLSNLPKATELAVGQGLTDPELRAISAMQDDAPLAPIEVRFEFADEYDSAQVYVTPAGEIASSEEFALLDEAERASYFHDADRFVAAVEAMLDQVGAEEIIDIGNYGDRLHVEAYVDAGAGRGENVRVTHREGRIAEIEAPEPTTLTPDERFTLDEFDWVSVFGGIAEGQRIMAEAGAEGTEPTHILIRRDGTHASEGNESYARIYLSNAYDEGGYVVVYGDGSIGRVSGP